MYSDQQAKNGFRTFVVTLSVSLLLFGAFYYLITDFSTEIDIESSSIGKTETVAYKPQKVSVKGVADQNSVFGEISDTPIDIQPPAVLAGAEESTESTVPDTGSEQIIGMALTMSFFSIAVYILLVGPRKLALREFEKDMTNGPNTGT